MKRLQTIGLMIVLFVVWATLAGGISFYVDALWFDSVGYWGVFATEMTARMTFFSAGFALTFALVGFNLWLASRRTAVWHRVPPEVAALAQKGTGYFFGLAAAGLALMTGMVAQANWLELLRYSHRAPTGQVDPLFGLDLAFYFFTLPAITFAVNFLLAALLLSLVAAGVSYVLRGHLALRPAFEISREAGAHLCIVAGFVFVMIGARFWLARYEVLYSAGGVVFGAGYTDIYARLPVYFILTVLAAAVAALFFAAIVMGNLRAPALAAAGFGVAFLLLNLYPSAIQAFVVDPNELDKERPYIEHNIASTLQAYKLDSIEVRDFAANPTLDPAALQANASVQRNIRLWDWRPLMDAYNQLQSIRLYYEFADVDIDRYVINGQYRQVMLSARELNFNRISRTAQNWINKHFFYTHGYGVCLSPVNEVTREGLPAFFVQDIPPRSSVDLEVSRPEIYFGELTNHPVFVRTARTEFDYPLGETNAYTTYEEDRGIPINSLLMKSVFAWELGLYRILFSEYLTEDSRVLLHRNVGERVRRLFEFLLYDRDPYLVLHEGRMFWIIDGYTASNRYPYSEPFQSTGPRYNYIRNSVKAVVDAYRGDVTFYVSDPDDPLIQVYDRIFPDLLRPLDEMPPGLRDHIRYPTDLFDIQRAIFRRYHMNDPTVFFNQEDLWEIPTELYRGNEQVMESYYVIMPLPGSEREELVLLIPFTPRGRDNMIGWLAGRSDGENYGKLVLYRFPKQELTYGPMQIEARIDQNPEISQLVTLWGQKGSEVIRGNLLVLPIEDSLLYVEPLYLQAEKSEIPELTRVLAVAGQGGVALGETLEEALRRAVGELPPAPLELVGAPTTSSGPSDAGFDSLESRALDLYRRAQQALREGDWNSYGEAQRQLGEVLQQLARQEPAPGG